MSSLLASSKEAAAIRVAINDDTIVVDLTDGRSVTVPISWYPRLVHATAEERSHWEPLGGGEGLHWPDLDEDIRVASLLEGRPSGESQESLRKWLAGRL